MELADRLPFCPRCSYPFTGLPDAHQCPECGIPYEAESQMWVAHLAERRIDQVGMLVMASFLTMFGLFQALAFRGKMSLILGLLNILIGTANFYMAYLGSKKKRRFIAVLPDGFWYMSRYHKILMIPWSKIRSAREAGAMGLVAFHIHLIPRGVVAVPRRLTEGVDIEDAVARINARIEKSTV